MDDGPALAKRDRTRTPFGRRMFDARKRAKLTQVEVGATLGVAQSTLSELESINHSSGRTTEFAVLYKCDAHWLATGEGSIEQAARTAAELPAKGAPPLPGPGFKDRRLVSESDWGLLQAVKVVVSQKEQKDIRERYQHVQHLVQEQLAEYRDSPSDGES